MLVEKVRDIPSNEKKNYRMTYASLAEMAREKRCEKVKMMNERSVYLQCAIRQTGRRGLMHLRRRRDSSVSDAKLYEQQRLVHLWMKVCVLGDAVNK